MPSAPSKLYSDDVSLLVVTLDTNPFFWASFSFPFSEFLSHVLAFINSILLLSQLNQVVVIATGCNSCSYVYDSASTKTHGSTTGSMPAVYSDLLHNLEGFVAKDQQLAKPNDDNAEGPLPSSLLSGSLSMALCYIQRTFRSGPIHPQPRILCLQGSADGPEQLHTLLVAYITGLPNWMGFSNIFLQCLRLICILVLFCGFLSLWVWIFVPRASVISKQLTWVMYVLYAYPYSASIMISVQLVGLYLARLNKMLPQLLAGKEKLDTLCCIRGHYIYFVTTIQTRFIKVVFHASSAMKFWRQIAFASVWLVLSSLWRSF